MADYKREDTASWDTEQVRRSQGGQTAPSRRPRKRKKHRFNIFTYLLFVLITSAILAGVGWLLINDLCAFNKEDITATIEVTADDSISTIADKLEDAGLIQYKWFFKLFATVADAKDKIGTGTYELNTDMDYRALIIGMHNSSGNLNSDTVRITIPEGYTVAQIIHLMAEKGVNTEENLLEAAKTANFDYEYIDNSSEDISRLEGFLFPDTYDFYLNEKPTNALNRLIKNFDSKLDDDLLALAQARGYDLKKIITIASLIEKETDGTDQAKIASVIYNRLEGPGDKGGTYGLLQIDASLLYALPEAPAVTATAEGFQLRAAVTVGVARFCPSNFRQVTGVTAQERSSPYAAVPSLTIVRWNGEDLWQLSKRYCSSERCIRETNGLLDDDTPAELPQYLLIPKTEA